MRVLVLPGGQLNHPRSLGHRAGRRGRTAGGPRPLRPLRFHAARISVRGRRRKACMVETAAIRLTIRLAGFFCTWESRPARWQPVCKRPADPGLQFRLVGRARPSLSRRDPGERYFGLGERAGDMDRAGRRFRMSNVDAMGYDARTSDPLYKHIPFYITRRADGAAVGLFYDTLSDCTSTWAASAATITACSAASSPTTAISTITSSPAHDVDRASCHASPG